MRVMLYCNVPDGVGKDDVECFLKHKFYGHSASKELIEKFDGELEVEDFTVDGCG